MSRVCPTGRGNCHPFIIPSFALRWKFMAFFASNYSFLNKKHSGTNKKY